MPPKPNIPPPDVQAKGIWKSPQQTYDSLWTTWQKFEREKVDLEAIGKEHSLSYFGRERRTDSLSEYDRFFSTVDFDPRRQREDRQNVALVRDAIFLEERKRTFPVVVSHTYGHRQTNLEGKTYRNMKKVETMSETRRRWYVNMKPTKKVPRDYKVESL